MGKQEGEFWPLSYSAPQSATMVIGGVVAGIGSCHGIMVCG